MFTNCQLLSKLWISLKNISGGHDLSKTLRIVVGNGKVILGVTGYGGVEIAQAKKNALTP